MKKGRHAIYLNGLYYTIPKIQKLRLRAIAVTRQLLPLGGAALIFIFSAAGEKQAKIHEPVREKPTGRRQKEQDAVISTDTATPGKGAHRGF